MGSQHVTARRRRCGAVAHKKFGPRIRFVYTAEVDVKQPDQTLETLMRPSQSPWRATVIVGTVLALVIAVVASFGGFRQRSDTRLDGSVGTTYSLNVADVTILRATAKLFDGTWTISVFGMVLNTTDRPLRAYDLNQATLFSYFDSSGTLVYYQAANTPMVLVSDSDPTIRLPRVLIPPGSRDVPVRFTLYVDGTLLSGTAYQPDAVWAENISIQDGLFVRLTPVHYLENTILGISNDKEWVIDRSASDYHYWQIHVPIEIVEG